VIVVQVCQQNVIRLLPDVKRFQAAVYGKAGVDQKGFISQAQQGCRVVVFGLKGPSGTDKLYLHLILAGWFIGKRKKPQAVGGNAPERRLPFTKLLAATFVLKQNVCCAYVIG
jgi:hypothetical protein